MTTYAVEAGRRAWETLPRVRAWLEDSPPGEAARPGDRDPVAHDARPRAHRSPQRLALLPGRRPALVLRQRAGCSRTARSRSAFIGRGWPALLAPIAALGGPTLVPSLPAIVLFDVLVLGPVALLCIYGIAKRIGGQIFAYWAVLLWLTVPFIGIKFTDYLYHQRYTELTLPQGFGLTAMADFPSMVAVLVARLLRATRDRAAGHDRSDRCGLAGGIAVTIKPASAPFLGGLVLGFLYRRRIAGAAYLVAGRRAGAHHARALEVPRTRLPAALPRRRAHASSRSARSSNSWRSTRCTTTSSSTGTGSISTCSRSRSTSGACASSSGS